MLIKNSRKCCVSLCTGSAQTLFKFPTKEKAGRLWFEALDFTLAPEANYLETVKNYRICRDHFHSKYLYTSSDNKTKLWDHAVPNPTTTSTTTTAAATTTTMTTTTTVQEAVVQEEVIDLATTNLQEEIAIEDNSYTNLEEDQDISGPSCKIQRTSSHQNSVSQGKLIKSKIPIRKRNSAAKIDDTKLSCIRKEIAHVELQVKTRTKEKNNSYKRHSKVSWRCHDKDSYTQNELKLYNLLKELGEENTRLRRSNKRYKNKKKMRC